VCCLARAIVVDDEGDVAREIFAYVCGIGLVLGRALRRADLLEVPLDRRYELSSSERSRDRKGFLSSVFGMSPRFESDRGRALHLDKDGRCWGSITFLQLVEKVQKNTHRSALIGLYDTFFSTSGAIQPFVPHWSSTSSSSSFTRIAIIKVNDFQAKVAVNKKVVRLDIPVSDTEPVEIRETIDEARRADLNDLGSKPFRRKLDKICHTLHFG